MVKGFFLSQLRQLEQCVLWLERTGDQARAEDDWPRMLRCSASP